MRFAGSFFILCFVTCLASACESQTGDPHSLAGPPPLAGTDRRLSDIGDPSKPDHPKDGDAVAVSGVTVVAVDRYDETGDGRSSSTLYVQDLGATTPYSGMGVFSPIFVPANLRVGPGDVLDLRGGYQENASIGSATFAPGAVLPQLSRPTATLRFEHRAPEAIDIELSDLNDFAKARQWLGMLVRVKNVNLQDDVNGANLFNGRLSVFMTPIVPGAANACDAPFPKPAALTNELFPAESLKIPKGTVLKTVTGVVTFFCNVHLSPRSAADIER